MTPSQTAQLRKEEAGIQLSKLVLLPEEQRGDNYHEELRSATLRKQQLTIEHTAALEAEGGEPRVKDITPRRRGPGARAAPQPCQPRAVHRGQP